MKQRAYWLKLFDKVYHLRPTVEILFDSQDRKPPKRKVINLADAPLLYITDTAYESELPH